ncbi:hypothetical protein CK203_017983 [Vitis vinifera]|uniref:Reverse transcriptase zinc-binding domain-containing protein n=1 Tax=Vitis vinifera TaxID=29760 RepID=A0A438JW96_VITVI|nr:hypothetical protein CK203_017983 [Vitis vinifera]
MPIKGRLFGSKSSIKSMVKRIGGGVPMRLAYQVGNEQRVRFWMDKWCGDEPLSESFPSIFTLFMSKEAWAADVWNPEGEGGSWTPLFSRAFNDWELELVECFCKRFKQPEFIRIWKIK